MGLSRELVRRFHLSSFSARVSTTPGVNVVARAWWMRYQSRAFSAAMSSVQSPLAVADSDNSAVPDVPTRADIVNREPRTTAAGDAFSAMMADWHTTKFHTMGYQDIYGRALAHLVDSGASVLELGIGINDPTVPSGMQVDHVPGASLRGWKHGLKAEAVWGADIDERALVDTDDYRTVWVDQRDINALLALRDRIPLPLDLVVDDGLHTPEANALAVQALLPTLSQRGVMVVEDIQPEFDHLWESAAALLPDDYALVFIPSSALRQTPDGTAVGGVAALWRTR